jgi:hypothetical protein
MGKLHWHNIVSLPHNNTRKSIGKARAKRQNAAVHWQNVVALAAEQNTTIKWESAGAMAERCSANDAMEHDPAALDDGGCTVREDWQNVVALAAEQNTTIKWESVGATAERCSANDATEDWQNVVAPPQNETSEIDSKVILMGHEIVKLL